MYKLIPIAIVFYTLTSCNGGRCIYKDMPFKATIVSIEKENTPSPYDPSTADPNTAVADFGYKVKLVTNLPKHDTLYLDEMTKRKIAKDFLQEHHLTEGTVLEGVANVRTSGTCAPGNYRFNDSTLNR